LTLPGSEDVLKNALKKKSFRATTDYSDALKDSDAIVVIVPLVVDENKNIDFKIVDSVTIEIGKHMKKGATLVYETSFPVGTTRNRLKELIIKQGKLKENDFYLAYSPERVSTNTVFKDLENIPKIVAGTNPESSRKVEELYSQVLPKSKIINVENTDVAELVKLMELIYRDVNISLSNELAVFCDAYGFDINTVIRGCNEGHPFTNLLRPGIGAGGHCLPVYPYFYFKNAMEKGIVPNVAISARNMNDSMPDFSIKHLEKKIGKLDGKKVLVLGLGYREDIKETFLSPSLKVIEILRKKKTDIYLDDYLFSKEEIERFGVNKYDLFSQDEKFDAVILVTFHSKYRSFKFEKIKTKAILDGRNVLDREKIEKSGIKYIGIGR
jgi:nucleotide sugar dehydrogenase